MSSQHAIELPPEYDTLHVGIALYESETGTILDTNTRLESMLGYPAEQLREIPVERYTANTYPFSETDFIDRLRASASGNPQQFNWRIKRGDGELIWTRIHLSQHSVGRNKTVLAEIRDVTAYYDTSHRAELFWRLLRHNLRNEATIIHGNATHIGDRTVSNSIREASETIQHHATELGSIAKSVKEIEQAVNATDTQRVRRNATVAVEAVADAVLSDYPAAEITIEAREAMWVQINTAFTNALTHALENAIVHSQETEPLIEIEIGPSPNTSRVDIQISDSNPSIRDVEIDSLFTHNETTSTAHGSGVGLFVMKWCIESLGGEIEFKRRTPEGNTVHFYLPPKEPPDSDPITG